MRVKACVLEKKNKIEQKIILPILDSFYHRNKAQMTNMIEVTFRTRDQDGMILYNGVGPKPKMGDFLFIAVYKGEVILGYNLGGGFRKIVESLVYVSNDEWHTVKVTR